MDPFIGEIRAFAFGVIPRGWHLCDGTSLPIVQNQALFALLGTRYGGNGTTTFQLPDLRGRVPLCSGISPGGQTYQVGDAGGSESVALTVDQVPPHTHTLACSNASAGTNAPSGAVPAMAASGTNIYADAATPALALAAGAVTTAGQGIAHNNMQPTLAVSFCIATGGLWPARD